MLYRPPIFVSPENVKLVSTFVASTFTPTITPPLGSVTRPVRVAVGPASREPATRQAANNIKSSHAARLSIISALPRNFCTDYVRVFRLNCRFVPTHIPLEDR